MAYSSGMLNKRITIAKRTEAVAGKSGRDSAGIKYEIIGTFWAGEDFNKGVKSLRNGAVEAYNVVMFRMRYHECINRWCLIQYNGTWYEIESCNEDQQANTIQITAHEMPNQKVTLVEDTQK